METRPTFDCLGVTIDGKGDPDIDKLDVNEVIDLFKSNGALLFTDFDVDVKKFESFTDKFSSDYMDHTGGGSLRRVINEDGDKTILSVSYSFNKKAEDFEETRQKVFPLALHSDRSYTKSQPPVMWFYCLRPAEENGETLLCDGVKLFQELNDETKAFFKNNKINYIRNYADGEWQLWANTDSMDDVKKYCKDNNLILTINDDNSITTQSIKSAVVKPRWTDQDAFVNSILLVLWQEEAVGTKRSIVRMEDGSEIPPEMLKEVRDVSDRLTRGVKWEPGQLVMVDNTRMLHGRNAFEDRNREVYVRMSRSVEW
jgi:alpha-ketoglutarate-dependent taurine dioxygenase